MVPVNMLPFLAVAAIVVITPGADMALVTKNALMHGRQAAVATAVGINLGVAFWTLAAALGLAAIVAASAAVFTTIKLVGAAYLVFLGVQALLATRARRGENALDPTMQPPLRRRVAFRQGLVSNILNPKIAVFFTSLLPQFVTTRGAVGLKLLALGGLFNVMGVAWLLSYAVLAARGRTILTRPRVRRSLDRLTGVVLIGLGARLALERRR